MKRITYGATRLVDWVAQIKSGGATLRVHFSGGALTAYGITPAEYTTDNQFFQRVIENSDYFKSGRITVLRTVDIDAESEGLSKPKASIGVLQAKSAIKPNMATRTVERRIIQSVDANNGGTTNTAEGSDDGTEGSEDGAGCACDEAEGSGDGAEGSGDGGGMIEVKVNCLPDAQAYLQEHFKIASYKVRSCETAQRIASEHGVVFIGGQF